MRRLAAAFLLLLAGLTPAADPKPRLDADGFPLPAEAVRRFGSAKFLGDWVKAVAVGRDGKTVFALGSHQLPGFTTAGTVTAWDTATGRRLWAVEEPRASFDGLAAAPDGEHVWATASGPTNVNGEGALVRLKLAARTGRVVGRAELRPARWGGSALHPTGLVTWSRYDAATSDLSMPITAPDGKEQARWEPEGEWIGTSAFAPDGKAVFIAGDGYKGDGRFKIRGVDAATGKGLWAVESAAVAALAVTPDGKHLLARVAAGPLADPKFKGRAAAAGIRVLDAESGKDVAQVELDGMPFGAKSSASGVSFDRIVFHPDGMTAFVSGLSGTSIPIDLTTWKAGKPEEHPVARGTFAPDGKSHWVAAGRTLQRHDTATHKLLTEGPLPLKYEWGSSTLPALEFSADERLLSRSGRGSERVSWAVATGKELSREAVPPATAASPDGKRVLRQTDARTWEVATADGKQVVPLAMSSRYDICRFCPDGSRVLSATTGGIRLWDAETGALRPVTAAAKGSFASTSDSVRFLPGTNRVAVIETGGWEQRQPSPTIGLYDWARANRVAEVSVPGRIESWTVSAGGLLGVLSVRLQPPYEGVLTVLPPGSDTPVSHKLDSPARSAAVSPDGRTFAVGSTTGIHLIDPCTGAKRHTFTGLTRAAEALTFSPTGRYLASESADGPVLLWDVRGELLATPEPDSTVRDQLLADLASDDGAKAFQAVRALAAHPATTRPFLKAKVAARKQPTAEKIAARVAKLDAKDFAERDAAEKELRAMGAVAHPALKAALAANPTPELRTRATRLLAVTATPPALLAARLAEVAEWAGGKELLAEWTASEWPELKAEADAARKRGK